jgi:hypothetical protein
MSYAFGQGGDQESAFKSRVYDALVRVKQELGVDELLLAIDDAKKIASKKVSDYLNDYKTEVAELLEKCDTEAETTFTGLMKKPNRSVRNIEKLVAMAWKTSYEFGMTDLNSRMPLAQQIVSKYMANFSVKPSMK